MILRILLILEIMTVIVVLHSVNRQKTTLDIKTLILILTHVVFMEIVNKYELSNTTLYLFRNCFGNKGYYYKIWSQFGATN